MKENDKPLMFRRGKVNKTLVLHVVLVTAEPGKDERSQKSFWIKKTFARS